MKKQLLISLTAAALSLSACAKPADKVTAQYVSPIQYQAYSCNQLSAEAQRVAVQASTASGVQNKKAQNDALVTGAAVVLFWPAAFFVGGNNENTAELARLKGELDAIERASISKNCGIEFRRQG
ncbi:hypothetical protein [Donghicola mangrovi]|uniref:Lipoprotein n=1 Tax=Donghicola mangrovi TaxID=2729614 RepID=A0A850Q0W6_9RHOB|nr:hypothetical protein [Donghicola mangrovi]NVO22634.1 hypothetical protein [Donghicola mangrovi]